MGEGVRRGLRDGTRIFFLRDHDVARPSEVEQGGVEGLSSAQHVVVVGVVGKGEAVFFGEEKQNGL